MLSRTKWLTAGIALGLALGAAGIAVAAEPHAHVAAIQQLTLDHGKKWQTDDALRRGMDEIRNAMAEALGPIDAARFTAKDYAWLAQRVQQQVDYVVANCKLPEDADAQLHLVLEQIIDGIAEMNLATRGEQGAIRIVQALKAYGDHFDHPGWTPPVH